MTDSVSFVLEHGLELELFQNQLNAQFTDEREILVCEVGVLVTGTC